MADSGRSTTGTPGDGRVFDEAAEDVRCGRTESAALHAARAELGRLAASPSRMPALAGSPWAFVAGVQIGVIALWTVIGWWIAAIAAVLAIGYEVLRHRRVRRHRVYWIGACRSCGYSMEGLVDAIRPELLNDRRVGPQTCPECGTRWPRLPPE